MFKCLLYVSIFLWLFRLFRLCSTVVSTCSTFCRLFFDLCFDLFILFLRLFKRHSGQKVPKPALWIITLKAWGWENDDRFPYHGFVSVWESTSKNAKRLMAMSQNAEDGFQPNIPVCVCVRCWHEVRGNLLFGTVNARPHVCIRKRCSRNSPELLVKKTRPHPKCPKSLMSGH